MYIAIKVVKDAAKLLQLCSGQEVELAAAIHQEMTITNKMKLKIPF